MVKPLRVLQVFSGMSRHGAESMIMNIYRNIDRSKVQFDFVVHTNKDKAYDQEIKSLGGKIFRVPRYTGKNHFKYVRSWEKIFSSYPEYKIVHGHVRSTALIYLRIAKKYGLTTIVHSHSTSNGAGLNSIVKNIFQLPLKNKVDYLFAASIESGIWLYGEQVINKENFYVINNAIETKKYLFDDSIRNRKRRELGINNEIVLGHVGRLVEVKNHSFLLKVFKEYNRLNENSLLLLVGDGELGDELKKRVEDYQLVDKVKFLGSRSDVNELLQVMDVFIFPSLFEGLPVTLVEAQAAGLPIIVSDNITEEIKLTGLLTFKNINESPLVWAKEIDKLYQKPRENMYEKIRASGYDISKTTKDLERFYTYQYYNE